MAGTSTSLRSENLTPNRKSIFSYKRTTLRSANSGQGRWFTQARRRSRSSQKPLSNVRPNKLLPPATITLAGTGTGAWSAGWSGCSSASASRASSTARGSTSFIQRHHRATTATPNEPLHPVVAHLASRKSGTPARPGSRFEDGRAKSLSDQRPGREEQVPWNARTSSSPDGPRS